MAGKKMRALFELIRDPGVNRAQKFPVAQQARKVGDPLPPPPPQIRPKIDIPVRQPVQAEPPKINLVAPKQTHPSAAPAPALAGTSGEKRFTVTQSTFWMILAGVIVLAVIIWWA